MSCFTRRGESLVAGGIRFRGRRDGPGKSAGTWCIRSIGENRLGTRLLRHRIEKLEAMRSVRRISRQNVAAGLRVLRKAGVRAQRDRKGLLGRRIRPVSHGICPSGINRDGDKRCSPLGAELLRRNGCGAQGFRRCRFGAEDAGKRAGSSPGVSDGYKFFLSVRATE